MHCRLNPNLGSDNENTMTYFFLNNEEKVDVMVRKSPHLPPTAKQKMRHWNFSPFNVTPFWTAHWVVFLSLRPKIKMSVAPELYKHFF